MSHQIRIVALYILLLFATLYGKIHDFSMERCMQRTGYEWSALFRKMSTFKLDSPKRNQAPFSLKWNPPRKPSSRGNFPFMYILYRFLIVHIRIVALYILLLFATLYGKILDFSMERCVQRTGYILVWPAPKKNQNKKQKTNKKQGPFFFVS